jgi:protein O-mannosyl-transferase
MIATDESRLRAFLCALLATATLAVYSPVRSHEFVRYDDDTYVTQNPAVRAGLSWQGLRWAFTSDRAANWHPLTWLSHMLDCQMFGVRSSAHHLVNVLFHVANSLLLLIVLRRLTHALWPSAFVAGLFALHPLHVESVAWVAERKDVLSTLFWLLATWAYARYVERQTRGRYLATLALFTLGLLAKPMLVTLPVVLLLLDFWPMRRLTSRAEIRRALLEKVPMLALSAASSVITLVVQQQARAVSSLSAVPVRERLINSVCAYGAYIVKLVWPADLAVLYPHPTASLAASAALLTAGTLAVVYFGRERRYLLVGWLWYLVTLAPVIGLVQVGAQALADRYTYVPAIGLFLVVSFGAAELVRAVPSRRLVAAGLAAALLVACALLSVAQLAYWQNSETLFGHALAVTKDNPIIAGNYANILSERGRLAEALPYYVEALKTRAHVPGIHANYGITLAALGRFEEAIAQLRVALRLNPSSASVRYNLAVVLAQKGDDDAALEQYQAAVALAPDLSEALCNIGEILVRKGEPQRAVEYFERTLRIEPRDLLARRGLALSLMQAGRTSEAIEQYREALRAQPNDVELQAVLRALERRQRGSSAGVRR